MNLRKPFQTDRNDANEARIGFTDSLLTSYLKKAIQNHNVRKASLLYGLISPTARQPLEAEYKDLQNKIRDKFQHLDQKANECTNKANEIIKLISASVNEKISPQKVENLLDEIKKLNQQLEEFFQQTEYAPAQEMKQALTILSDEITVKVQSAASAKKHVIEDLKEQRESLMADTLVWDSSTQFHLNSTLSDEEMAVNLAKLREVIDKLKVEVPDQAPKWKMDGNYVAKALSMLATKKRAQSVTSSRPSIPEQKPKKTWTDTAGWIGLGVVSLIFYTLVLIWFDNGKIQAYFSNMVAPPVPTRATIKPTFTLAPLDTLSPTHTLAPLPTSTPENTATLSPTKTPQPTPTLTPTKIPIRSKLTWPENDAKLPVFPWDIQFDVDLPSAEKVSLLVKSLDNEIPKFIESKYRDSSNPRIFTLAKDIELTKLENPTSIPGSVTPTLQPAAITASKNQDTTPTASLEPTKDGGASNVTGSHGSNSTFAYHYSWTTPKTKENSPISIDENASFPEGTYYILLKFQDRDPIQIGQFVIKNPDPKNEQEIYKVKTEIKLAYTPMYTPNSDRVKAVGTGVDILGRAKYVDEKGNVKNVGYSFKEVYCFVRTQTGGFYYGWVHCGFVIPKDKYHDEDEDPAKEIPLIAAPIIQK